jgi:hypothetical protein
MSLILPVETEEDKRFRNDELILETKKKTASGEIVSIHDVVHLLHKDVITLRQKQECAEMFGFDLVGLNKLIAAATRNEGITQYLKKVPKTEYEFIDLLMDKWGVSMSFDKIFTLKTPYCEEEGLGLPQEEVEKMESGQQIMWKTRDPKILPFHVLLDKIRKTNAEVLNSRYKGPQLEYALSDWATRRKNLCIAGRVSELVYGPHEAFRVQPEWDNFVNAITDTNKDETQIILKPFIWQVKRKITGQKVEYHMMPIMNGKQGGGKSTVVEQFLSPVENFTCNANFNDITDERNHDIWANFVLVFDEMGHSATANLEVIKQKITTSSFTGRVMRSNGSTNIINNTTCIGTSNKDLGSMVFDNTGMRRFYQIDCLDMIDWAATDKVDYDLLWKSVNENAPTPLLQNPALWQKIQGIQEESRQITLLEQFLLDRKYAVMKETLTATQFYEEFKEYEKANTSRPDSNVCKFGRSIVATSKQVDGLKITKIQGKIVKYEIDFVTNPRK